MALRKLNRVMRFMGMNDSDDCILKFIDFLALIQKWSKRYRIVGDPATDIVETKHFIDSLTLYPFMVHSGIGSKVLDIGSGAGFPAIPLAIVLPAYSFILVESRKQRIEFLRTVIRTLHLKNCIVIDQFLSPEEQIQDAARTVDWITGRAVSSISTLISIAWFYLKPTGSFLLQRGVNVSDELTVAAPILENRQLIVQSLVSKDEILSTLSRYDDEKKWVLRLAFQESLS